MVIRIRRHWLALAAAIVLLLSAGGGVWLARPTAANSKEGFIKWVDFCAPYEALERALSLDIASHEKGTPVSWIDLLAYITAKNGNDFSSFQIRQLDEAAEKLQSGTSLEELTGRLQYFSYYQETYTAALGGLVGDYEVEVADETAEGGKRFEKRYGLKAFSPIAKNFPYYDFDDFGTSRSYGFKRRHLGHDLMGQVGTPIVAVETGVVEAMGWNQYGGWRIGIRSLDGKRYYYYAHLRKNFPYRLELKQGDVVQAGDVIGYMGRTGYSVQENVNNIDDSHLHFGLQLIFDESQKESNNEIWIDVYPIIRLLSRHRSETIKNLETKDYSRVYDFRDLSPVGDESYRPESMAPSDPLDNSASSE